VVRQDEATEQLRQGVASVEQQSQRGGMRRQQESRLLCGGTVVLTVFRAGAVVVETVGLPVVRSWPDDVERVMR
jgi:hypothetical protein